MRRALLVGIDNYEHSALTGCVNDATSMRDLLARNEDGEPNFDCKLITAPDDYISKSFLREQLEVLFGNEAAVALFYFAGHGTYDNLDGYLVTQDAGKYDEGIAMRDILLLANRSRSIQEIVIILDCCHSGKFGNVTEFDNRNALLKEGVSILTASRSTQPAAEAAGSGVFTSLVRNALNGGAADVCGNVTVAAVYAYVDQILGAWDQRPLFKSHVSKLIPLRKCKPEIELSIIRKLPKYFPHPDYDFKLDPSYEPDAEPKDQEHEKIFSHLQKYRDARLLIPVGEKHLYFAAMNCKSCKLIPIGQYYWDLVDRGKI
jgi:hypothetical protein